MARVILAALTLSLVLLCGQQNPISQDADAANLLPLAVPGKVTLVDFSASWCGPCKMQKPIVEALARELGNRVAIRIIDVEKDSRAKAYRISAVPTLVFHDATGAERHRVTGVMPREAILARLNELGMPAPGAVDSPAPAKPSPKNTLTLD